MYAVFYDSISTTLSEEFINKPPRRLPIYNDIAKLLITRGANINESDSSLLSPLIHAIIVSNFDAVRLLIEVGADVNTRDFDLIIPLMYAVSYGYCYDVFYSNIIPRRSSSFNNITRLLISNGADAYATDNNLNTVFMYATAANNTDAIKIISELDR